MLVHTNAQSITLEALWAISATLFQALDDEDREDVIAVVVLAAADMGGEGRDRRSLRLHQARHPAAKYSAHMSLF